MAFRDYILDRFWLKLFSFILATLIWFTVQSKTQTPFRFATNPFTKETREISRPVRLIVLPTTRRFFKPEPVEVRSKRAGDRIEPVRREVNSGCQRTGAFVGSRGCPHREHPRQRCRAPAA